MISLHSTIIVISWLATLSSSFSPGLPSVSVSSPASQHHDFLNVNGASYSCKCNKSKRKSGSPTPIAPLHLSQSANDNINGFHYDQEPRGTSFISQVSQQDLWERRQMRRPQQQRLRQALQQRAPNSRGAVTGQNHQQYMQQPMPMQQYYPTSTNTIGVGATEEELGVVGDGEDFDIFKDNVSTNLKSMTTLLKEMQQSQSVQSSDVQSLTFKVADMTDRLYRAEQMKNRINKGGGGTAASSSSSSSSQMDVTSDRNFGTSLDGEFNKNVKNHIVDEFEMVDNSRDNYHQQQQQQQQPLESGGTGGEYYKEKIAQLEARINMIDDDLQTTEDRFNTQMEYVDMLVNQRLDDVDGQQQASFEFERMPFQNQPPPGIMMGEPPFRMEDGPLPPPPPPPRPPTMEEMEAQMQQQQQQSSQEMDDGRQHFQERNYNVPNIPPPHEQVIPSSQNQQQQQQQQRQSDQSRSVNTRSGGHHYNEKNTSFMSAFSKADNEQRKQFQPFTRDPRRNEVRVGEQLPRGVVNAPNRQGGGFVAPPPPGGPMMNPDMMSPDFGGEIDGPYHMMMEGGGPMMMEDDRMMFEDEMMMQGEYFDNDMMYGF